MNNAIQQKAMEMVDAGAVFVIPPNGSGTIVLIGKICFPFAGWMHFAEPGFEDQHHWHTLNYEELVLDEIADPVEIRVIAQDHTIALITSIYADVTGSEYGWMENTHSQWRAALCDAVTGPDWESRWQRTIPTEPPTMNKG